MVRRAAASLPSVHPRECGGNGEHPSLTSYAQGPSPRVRGKPHLNVFDVQPAGSIPASAGETGCRAQGPAEGRVHPRECGGNTRPSPARPDGRGPSPRVRGKLHQADRRQAGVRSIPASAGETSRFESSTAAATVHPRECGGNGLTGELGAKLGGPSPRVRGKRWPRAARASRRGSIPASAGETNTSTPPRGSTGVHPRECGGNVSTLLIALSSVGPSPRVRGKPLDGHVEGGRIRSIPASAGETNTSTPPRGSTGVHPRECGGNVSTLLIALSSVGPSPRVRGKRLRAAAPGNRCGSIPASAGETPSRPSLPRRTRVHPRECGGNDWTSGSGPIGTGPSPRVRGKPCPGHHGGHRWGSIPASAGETEPDRRPGRTAGVHPRECGGNRIP